jgi:alpha-glucoside transport system substrate-binding protein
LKNIRLSLLVFMLGLFLVVTACSGDSSGNDQSEEANQGENGQEQDGQEQGAEGGSEGSYLEAAYAGEFEGTSVEIMGAFGDPAESLFNETLQEFGTETGIDVSYAGNEDISTTFGVRVDAGNPPDIIGFPQPGALRRYVESGDIVDVESFLSREYLEQQYDPSWLDMVEMEGPDGTITAGVWQSVNAKSFIWYPKAEFEANGYEIPETWDELLALSDQIVEDGYYPWTLGIESGPATGWPATDWIEDIMLRTVSLEDYDRWVQGDLPFTSPEVERAFEIMAEIWFDEDYVYGGVNSIVTTDFGVAPDVMFNDPPRAFFNKQGSFIQDLFPEHVTEDDYDFFLTPAIDEEYGQPLLVGGDTFSVVTGQDRPEVRAVLEFLTTGESLKLQIESGAAISPHQDSDLNWYSTEMEQRVAEQILEADAVRFDGSDAMPAEVGTGTFWTGLTDWIAGQTTLEEALEEIQSGFGE